MAEQIPFNIIADALTKLGSSALQKIGSAFGVAKELTKLTKKLDTIKGVMVDADMRQEESDAVKSWLRRLKDVVYAADDLLDDFATHQLQRGGVAKQVSNFFSSSNEVAFRFKMSNRLKDIKEKVDEIVIEASMLNLIRGNITHREAESRWRETHSFVLESKIVGREENSREIIKSLVSSDNRENLSMVAIVGIGGLGKTTLAQLVYNDNEVVQYFERRIWVCVSDNFDVKLLFRKILQEVRAQDVEKSSLEALVDLLHENLSEKRCLLVLDDVWNENLRKWDQLKILLNFVGEGSKILVTTRSSKVASMMGIDSPFVLEGLKDTDSWDLFSKIAFTEEPEKVDPEFEKIGKEIVNMCNGVPLLIKALGSLLRFRTEVSDWLSIKNNKNMLSYGAENDDVLAVLKLSYDNLPMQLRECFTYCAVFPRDYEIEKKSLVQLWIAQGYIQISGLNEHLEDIGGKYFEELLSRSFFEEGGRHPYSNKIYYRMQNLMHDVAELIGGSDVVILTDQATEIPKTRHILLVERANPMIKSSQKNSIRTFIMHSEDGFEDDSKDNSILNRVISRFKHLRALSLNDFNIKKVPKFLGELTHLRYLDLSNNDFKALPSSITRLKHLQTLKVIDCLNLKEFPKDTRELIHLRHLENDGCGNLTHMPCGIGVLTSLRSLPIFVVGNRRGYSRDRKTGGLGELKELDNLRRELRIKNLENVLTAEEESREANLARKQHIRSLRLEWRDPEATDERRRAAESILEGLRPHDQLEKLWIDGYTGEKFPMWMMTDGVLSKLVHIVLFSCERCQILPPFAQLPALQFMWLSGLEELEYVTECSSATPFFPSLKVLQLNNLPKLNGLRKKDSSSEQDPSFPLLSNIDIGFCHKLTSLTLHSSSSLRNDASSSLPKASLTLHHCLNLKSLILPSSACLLELSITTCCNLESLELPSSPLLSKLYINGCNNLKSLNLDSSPDLSQLIIWDCHNLTSLAQPSSPCLSRLEIRDCPNLTSFKLGSAPELSSLEIRDCGKLTSLQLPLLPCLKELHLNTLSEEVLQQLTFGFASQHT